MKRGISEVIAFTILLLILVIIVPVAFLMMSQPTIQQQQIIHVQPYKNLAQEQYSELKPLQVNSTGIFLSSVIFAYNESDNNVYFIFTSNSTLSVPIVVEYLVVFNGSQWIKLNIIKNGTSLIAEPDNSNPTPVPISPSNANSVFNNFQEIKIHLETQPYGKQGNYIVAVTQYGNIIYSEQISEIQQLLSYLD